MFIPKTQINWKPKERQFKFKGSICFTEDKEMTFIT